MTEQKGRISNIDEARTAKRLAEYLEGNRVRNLKRYYTRKERFPDLLRMEEKLKKRIQRDTKRLKELREIMKSLSNNFQR